MSRTKLGFGTLLLGGTLLVITWLVTTVPTPPLYDGLALPPQPYRYLQTPAGHKVTGQPGSVADTLIVSPRGLFALVLYTPERPPQAQLDADQNAIYVRSHPTQVAFTIRPVPSPAPPSDGTIDGNVYQFTAQAKGGVVVRFRKKVIINLRGTGLPGSPVIERYAGGHWARLATQRYIGVAMYSTNVAYLGDFALVVPGKTGLTPTGKSFLPYIIVAALVVGLTVVGLLLVRMSRLGTTDEPNVA
ncbi:MAG: hypothetical protein NVSMB52_09930 [Chloroflexota bacterium]